MKKNISMLMVVLALITITAVAYAEIEYISPTGVSQRLIAKHLYEAQQNEKNHCFATAGMTLNASNKAHLTIANTIQAVSDGKFISIAAATGTDDVIITSTLQAANTTRYYMFAYDATNSTTEVFAGVAGGHVEDIEISENHVPMAYVKVVTAGATFTMGTDAFDKSGVTSTFTNITSKPYKVKVLNTSR